jgi:osmotically-inducible protein OsmY
LGVDTCVKLIRDLVDRPEFGETGTTRAILADRVLEAQIRNRLADRFTMGTGVGGIRATASAGRVALHGLAIHSSLAEEAAKLVGGIAGVKEVDNRIEIVRGPRGI